MDKILFLDIDGVLNVIGIDRDEFGSIFHKEFEDNLRWVIEQTGAKIVISSTWKISGLKTMQRMWEKRNLAGEVIDITPTKVDVSDRGERDYFRYVSRGYEIQQWIKDNDVKCYCIIDDNDDMLESQLNNFVMTANNFDHPDCIDMGYGLTRKCAEKVVEILNKCK